MAAGEGQSGQGPALLGMLAEQFWRAADRRFRQFVESEVARVTAPVVRGGKLVASALSGVIPLASLPAHQTTHQSGGTDALTGTVDATARHETAVNGTLAGTRRRLNLVAGSDVTISGTDVPASERVDATIALPSQLAATARLNVLVGGTSIGTRRALNLIGSGAVTISGTDVPASERVDVTIFASGGGGGGGILYGPYSSRPSPGTAGRLYLATDSHYTYAVDTGTSWQEYLDGVAVTPPAPLSAWTALNMGTGFAPFEDRGAVGIAGQADAGSQQIAVLARPLGVSPPCRIVMALRSVGHGMVYAVSAGLINLTTTQVIEVGGASHYAPGTWDEQVAVFYRYNSPSSFNSSAAPGPPALPWVSGGVAWLRIDLLPASNTRQWYTSPDGASWVQFKSEPLNDFLTPTGVCIAVRRDGNYYRYLVLLHLSITAI